MTETLIETQAQRNARYVRESYHRHLEKSRAKQRAKPLNQRLVNRAKQRAREKGLPFDLTPADITVPEVCPVLGIPLRVNTGHPGSSHNSPTLDRLVPSKGYVKGNVVVMSAKANFIKQDAGSEDVLKVAEWLKSQGL